MTILGIDLCSIQGKVNWQKVRDSGIEFVYVKCGQYSNTPDWEFSNYIEQASAAGLSVGAYWFCTQQTPAVPQMKRFYEYASLHRDHAIGQNPGELPPMLDWEFCSKLPVPHCVDWLAEAAEEATKLWYGNSNPQRQLDGWPKRLPTIYTYPWFSKSHQPWLRMNPSIGQYPLTWAAYKSEGQKLVPWTPDFARGPEQLGQLFYIQKPWDKWTLWQYSGNNGIKVPGIGPDCDRQAFNGTGGDWDLFRGIYRKKDEIVHEQREDIG